MNPLNLRHLPQDYAYHVELTERGKSVIIDYRRDKKIVLAIILIVLIPMSFIMIISGKMKGSSELLPLSSRIFLVFLIIIMGSTFYFLFYYPLRIRLTRLDSGLLEIEKRGWFFVKDRAIVENNQKPYLRGKQRQMIGGTVILGKGAYQPLICYNINGQEQELSLILIASYFMRGAGPRGVLTKEQIQEIGKQLDLKVTFEE